MSRTTIIFSIVAATILLALALSPPEVEHTEKQEVTYTMVIYNINTKRVVHKVDNVVWHVTTGKNIRWRCKGESTRDALSNILSMPANSLFTVKKQ